MTQGLSISPGRVWGEDEGSAEKIEKELLVRQEKHPEDIVLEAR